MTSAHDESRALPPSSVVTSWLPALAAQGYRSVRTSAVAPAMAALLRDVGFVDFQRLVLLSIDAQSAYCSRPPSDLDIGPVRSPFRRLSRRTLDRIVDVDRRAFGADASLDGPGVLDALGATETTRVFAAGHPNPDGFVIAGRTGKAGYIQRLSVRPERQRVGLGSGLLSVAVAWLRDVGAEHVVVNTEDTNERALGLYRKFGFTEMPYPLWVMELSLAGYGERS